MEEKKKKKFSSKFEILGICMSSEHYEKISKIALKAIKENKFEKDIAGQIKVSCESDQLLNNDPFEDDIDIDGNKRSEEMTIENEVETEAEAKAEDGAVSQNEQNVKNEKDAKTEQNTSIEQNENKPKSIKIKDHAIINDGKKTDSATTNDVTDSISSTDTKLKEKNLRNRPLNLRSHNIGSWQCIVGKNFAFSINYQYNCMIYFQHKTTNLTILIYKSM